MSTPGAFISVVLVFMLAGCDLPGMDSREVLRASYQDYRQQLQQMRNQVQGLNRFGQDEMPLLQEHHQKTTGFLKALPQNVRQQRGWAALTLQWEQINQTYESINQRRHAYQVYRNHLQKLDEALPPLQIVIHDLTVSLVKARVDAQTLQQLSLTQLAIQRMQMHTKIMQLDDNEWLVRATDRLGRESALVLQLSKQLRAQAESQPANKLHTTLQTGLQPLQPQADVFKTVVDILDKSTEVFAYLQFCRELDQQLGASIDTASGELSALNPARQH